MTTGVTLIVLLALGLPQSTTVVGPGPPLARGDSHWNRRAEGHQEAMAVPGPIGEAVAAYQEALDEESGSLEIRWKLLRALAFQGDYATHENDKKRQIFERGRQLFEGSVDLLAAGAQVPTLDHRPREEVAEALADVSLAGRIYFWGAIHWGLWGQHFGAMAAVREGVAKRVRDYAWIAMTLDPNYENAGGHRVLGRLHSEAPKVPLFTGWIDREIAVTALEQALEQAPEDGFNRLFLADAWIRFRPAKRDQALEMLRDLVKRPLLPERLLEEKRVRNDAQALLDRLKKQ